MNRGFWSLLPGMARDAVDFAMTFATRFAFTSPTLLSAPCKSSFPVEPDL